MLDDSNLSNNQNEKKIEDFIPEETLNGESTGKVDFAKEQDTIASCDDAGKHSLDDKQFKGVKEPPTKYYERFR